MKNASYWPLNMSNVKAALKAAKAALDAHNYAEAAVQANTVLVADSKNYFGYDGNSQPRRLSTGSVWSMR